ncbi:MAG: hypothetical protein M3Y77_20040 [Actinomycetota bacterium]|nr:hypothetical protein [Actinomycetota bacterium]
MSSSSVHPTPAGFCSTLGQFGRQFSSALGNGKGAGVAQVKAALPKAVALANQLIAQSPAALRADVVKVDAAVMAFNDFAQHGMTQKDLDSTSNNTPLAKLLDKTQNSATALRTYDTNTCHATFGK